MNNITLTGRVTKAIRTNVVDGTPVVNFTTAIEFGVTPKMVQIEGKDVLAYVPATSYIDCAAWGPESDNASDLDLGQEVTFKVNSLGSKARKYEDKLLSDIVARVTDVKAGAKAKPKTGAAVGAAAGAASQGPGEESDFIPF